MQSQREDTHVRLNTGLMLPRIGFGTWRLAGDELALQATKTAIEVGYRLIDTAAIYGNEERIGEVVRTSGVPREELIVTTKLWKTDLGLARTKAAYENSLLRLGLDYIDLYLIHWPASEAWKESWQEMEALYREERVRNIGVSNFAVEDLQQLKTFAHLVPAVNQIELHPFNYRRQKPILDYCQEEGIVVEAYSPLAQMAWSDNRLLQKFAAFYSKTPAQIMLRWSLQHGAVPIPKATSREHITSNFQVFDFQLSEAEMVALNKESF